MNISRQPEYKRAKYIGRVFQDPMKVRRPAWKYRKIWPWLQKGPEKRAGWGIRANEKDYYHDLLTRLGLGFRTA